MSPDDRRSNDTLPLMHVAATILPIPDDVWNRATDGFPPERKAELEACRSEFARRLSHFRQFWNEREARPSPGKIKKDFLAAADGCDALLHVLQGSDDWAPEIAYTLMSEASDYDLVVGPFEGDRLLVPLMSLARQLRQAAEHHGRMKHRPARVIKKLVVEDLLDVWNQATGEHGRAWSAHRPDTRAYGGEFLQFAHVLLQTVDAGKGTEGLAGIEKIVKEIRAGSGDVQATSSARKRLPKKQK